MPHPAQEGEDRRRERDALRADVFDAGGRQEPRRRHHVAFLDLGRANDPVWREAATPGQYRILPRKRKTVVVGMSSCAPSPTQVIVVSVAFGRM